MNENKQSEVDKFFEGLPSDQDSGPADIFGTGETPTPTPEQGTAAPAAPAQGEGEHKNRRHRRWETRLADRERALELEAARLEGLKEARAAAEANPDIDPRLVQMYGAENMAASKLHQELLADYAKKAKDEAFQDFQRWQSEQSSKDAELDTFLQEQLEDLEDEYGVDLTSNSPAAVKARTDFLKLVEDASPKDKDGEVTDFADFKGMWNVYQANRRTPAPATSSRAREIATRSMETTGTGTTPPKAPTPGFDGWKRDLGIG